MTGVLLNLGIALILNKMESNDREITKGIFFSALRAVDPYSAVERHISHILSTYQNGGFNRLFIVGFGKAAFLMTKAVCDKVSNLITGGVVITKYGHALDRNLHPNIELHEAGHPIPDNNGLAATKNAVSLLKLADERTLVLCLISGGGSALLSAPKGAVSFDDKQRATELLLKAGASINELNTVRKHISEIKGGRLAEYAYPAKVVSLILSDVIGDELDVIASGPTTPDSTTYRMALDVVEKYRLAEKLPEAVLDILKDGVEGMVADTPKEGNQIFEGVENIIIGSNRKAALAAMEKAKELGFNATILSTEIQGEAIDAARWLAKKAIETKRLLEDKDGKKICLISGGETTVTVKGKGKGGRNTELALVFALEVTGREGITFLSAGTDGTDGPTDAAGAIVSGETIQKAESLNLDPESYLANNDSYTFFSKTGELFITGPTGTNVMDLQIILIS
jgi:hydroxypyruvate reductase/glycerate 2-kinase